jgi:hypothetical protein
MTIENTKTYRGDEVEQIFFRPSFCGTDADKLGIRVLYNMPMPTTVQVWSRPKSVLQPFECGWSGGTDSEKQQKTIDMRRVKAESKFSSEDYASIIFERMVGNSAANQGDLTGTALETAETELFRLAIAESVRSTLWIGDTKGEISENNTFDGILRHIVDMRDDIAAVVIATGDANKPKAIEMLKGCWDQATPELKALRSEGQLAYFVSSDVCNGYIEQLDEWGTDSAYIDMVNGHQQLFYRGIPVIEVPLNSYSKSKFTDFCMLTDRRNLVLALNTADMPENEVRMWYNPDQMENRQRAVFLAGSQVLDPNLVSIYYTNY